MDATTTDLAPYTIRTEKHEENPNSPTGTADDLHSALDAAWQLNRFTERPVVIIDNREDCPASARIVCRVSVEWLDGDE